MLWEVLLYEAQQHLLAEGSTKRTTANPLCSMHADVRKHVKHSKPHTFWRLCCMLWEVLLDEAQQHLLAGAHEAGQRPWLQPHSVCCCLACALQADDDTHA
jgi:hypothetical protein